MGEGGSISKLGQCSGLWLLCCGGVLLLPGGPQQIRWERRELANITDTCMIRGEHSGANETWTYPDSYSYHIPTETVTTGTYLFYPIF